MRRRRRLEGPHIPAAAGPLTVAPSVRLDIELLGRRGEDRTFSLGLLGLPEVLRVRPDRPAGLGGQVAAPVVGRSGKHGRAQKHGKRRGKSGRKAA